MINYNDTAIAAVNDGREIPDGFYNKSVLMAKRKYIATDGWRGYNTVTPEQGFIKVGEGTNCGGWDDTPAGTGEDEVLAELKGLEAKHGDIWVIWTPTSNVFATGWDAVARDPSAKPLKGKTIAVKTKRYELPNGGWRIQYHATDVVTYNPDKQPHYTLNSGGWATMTTAKRMNAALPASYSVNRKNWVLYVTVGNNAPVELIDGMVV